MDDTVSTPMSTFPQFGAPLIAPYWADADIRGIGNVYFRVTTSPTLLNQMTQDISAIFSGVTFVPQYLLVVTWFSVGYYELHTDLVNSTHAVTIFFIRLLPIAIYISHRRIHSRLCWLLILSPLLLSSYMKLAVSNGLLQILMVVLMVGFLSIIYIACLLYTSPSPRDATLSRMPSSA